MHRKCCIPGCNSSSRQRNVMHKMPAASEKVMLWYKTISAVPFTIFEGLTWLEIGKLYVCHKHFEAKYVSSKGLLKPNACPTLFTSKEIASGTPDNTSTEPGSMELKSLGSCEHTYARKCHYDHSYAMSISANHAVAGLSHNRTAADSGKLRTREERLCADTKARDAQIDAAPDIELPEIPEDATFNSPVPEVEDSGGETLFSWQNTDLIEADEDEEAPAPAPAPPADPTLALVCDPDPDPDPDPDLQPDQAVPSGPVPENIDVENRCKDCREVNEGLEFWCVQCGGGALCGACAARPPHHAHHVLRAPVGATRTVTQAVLAVIRKQLQNENLLSPHETVDDGLKVEVKEEPAENAPAEPDPLACETHESHEPQQPHSPLSSQEPHSPFSSQQPHSPYSSRESNSPPATPSPDEPDLPDEPHSPPEPAMHDADKCNSVKIVDHHKSRLALPRLRKATDHAHEDSTLTARRKLVKISPKQVKQAFLSHIERIVSTQQNQLKVYQPPKKHTFETISENLVSAQHNKVRGSLTHGGTSTSTTQHNQVRGQQAPIKVTSEPKPSGTVIIDLDDVADEETIEYLEEGLESEIEILDEHLIDEHEEDVLDELTVGNLSNEDRTARERGVKRKNEAEETLPVRGPSKSMVRALPSKAVVQVRPLSSLEIRNWTADRKRLRKN